ncbi:hypothetical protein [Rhodopirellula baltica]|uniref:Uncharacterized protein n=1 Tax=Rhodopirellula baltica SWK14 TaxID=993516 RepID=L7CG56_RHOBT|nr:hypothetical protein [Rhodopirellula baltica]ELP32041.1 hypothetical protein RBSWK_04039 [Rhodopirellula baltica SWK14]
MKKKARTKAAGSTKTRLEARVDEELASRFRSIAETAGISVNQLLQGLIVWATDNAIQGSPTYSNETREVGAEPRQGCVFFGKEAAFFDEEEHPETGEPMEPAKMYPGHVHFVLDFSYQNALRDK